MICPTATRRNSNERVALTCFKLTLGLDDKVLEDHHTVLSRENQVQHTHEGITYKGVDTRFDNKVHGKQVVSRDARSEKRTTRVSQLV